MKRPVFIGITRSFWLGIVPALLLLVDICVLLLTDFSLYGPITDLVLAFRPEWNPDRIHNVLQISAPITALIVTQQRMHATRPYTVEMSQETMK